MRWGNRCRVLARARLVGNRISRSPPLYDLHQPAVTGRVFGISDPARWPVTEFSDNCDVFFFDVIEGGNPNLRPETSTRWNLLRGIVWEPARGLTLGVDYLEH